jgi:DNA-binding transcriptional LysR family regulator
MGQARQKATALKTGNPADSVPVTHPKAQQMLASDRLLRRIDLITLQLFVAVCEEGNLTRAANRQGIAPSAVSKRLNDLERALGVTLLNRLPTGMTLTPAGESLLHHARAMLRNVQNIAVELSEYSHGIRGHVRLLANLSAIVEFLPEDLQTFLKLHNLLRFDLQERPSAGVVRGIEDGVADIGICSADTAMRALESLPYRRDHLVIIARVDHPLARCSSIHFADTLDFDHIGLHPESSIYLQSQYAAHQSGKLMKLRVHVPAFGAICRMVQAGLGIGVIPDRVFEALSEGMNLCSVRLLDSWAARELRIVVRDHDRLTTSSRLLLDHLAGARQG